MSSSFKEIPEDIAKAISSYPPEDHKPVYRAIRHSGPLEAKDFYPSFVDEKQQERRLQMSRKGGMANVISKQIKPKKEDIEYYGLSLFTSLDMAKNKFQSSPKFKKLFPCIAVGKTCREKGVAHKDDDCHVSYYLYDYENNNPFVDFEILEEDK